MGGWQRLPPNRKGTRWDQILAVLVCYRLLSPGSEWQLHRQWLLQSALADLLGGDFGLAEEHKLYHCHDHLLRHKAELFTHLRDRWRDLFNASFEVLLYDLTSTYFESHPPFPPGTNAGLVTAGTNGLIVKLLPQDGEWSVLAQSQDRVAKERSMRRRQLKWLWRRLKEIQAMELPRDRLMKKLGVAQHEAPTAKRLVTVAVAATKKGQRASFTFQLRKDKLRITRRREGRYLLRSNLTETDPGKLWSFYLQLTQVEEAFKNLKGDLAIRPIYHQQEARIEAHIFLAFLAYCLPATWGRRRRDLAPGLTTRWVLEKFAAVQMLDVRIPTTDQREVVLTRYTQPEPELLLLLEKLKLEWPPQPPPKITAPPRKADEAL